MQSTREGVGNMPFMMRYLVLVSITSPVQYSKEQLLTFLKINYGIYYFLISFTCFIFLYLQVNVPKTKKTFCKNKACKKHTLHKVTQYKKGKDSLSVQGEVILVASLRWIYWTYSVDQSYRLPADLFFSSHVSREETLWQETVWLWGSNKACLSQEGQSNIVKEWFSYYLRNRIQEIICTI